jgi:hypothetical protein
MLNAIRKVSDMTSSASNPGDRLAAYRRKDRACRSKSFAKGGWRPSTVDDLAVCTFTRYWRDSSGEFHVSLEIVDSILATGSTVPKPSPSCHLVR